MQFEKRFPRYICGALSAVLLWSASASAALINSYDFNGDLTDSLGNGLDLVASGGNLATAGRYTFGENQGLRLNSALVDTANYAIEVKFQMSSNNSFWKKVIDFQSLGSDNGLYIRSSSASFYNTGLIGATGIPVGTEVVMTLTRDGGSDAVDVRLDGGLEISFVDSGNLAVPSGNILNFFEDDFATGQGEAFAGSVDYIRIFDGPDTTIQAVPEPGMLLVIGLGLAGLGVVRRRQVRL